MLAWTVACSAEQKIRVGALRCVDRLVVLSTAIGDEAPLSIEATPSAGRGFREVAGVALSPIGEFPDWSRAPAATRDAFDRVAACVARDPSITAAPITPAPPLPPAPPPPPAPRTGAPWLLIAAMVVTVAAWAPALRRVAAARLRTGAALALLALIVAAARRALAGTAFFHQGGHGCEWVGYAVDAASPYGPGFEELFGWAARRAGDHPERAVFAAQTALAALGPPCAYLIARRAGARPILSWAAAIAIAIDPLLARLAGSESYYAAYTSLLLVAGALAGSGVAARSVRSAAFLLSTVGAGLVIAAAARVHPTGWIACALTPIVHLAAPGSIRRRARRAVIAASMIGLTVAVFSGPALLAVIGGGAGAKWLPFWRAALPTSVLAAAPIAIALTLSAAALARRRRDGMARAAALAIVLAATAIANMHRGTVDWVQGAYDRMYAAALVATLAGAAAGIARRPAHTRAAAAVVLAVSLLTLARRARWVTELPTDALELSQGTAWRSAVPAGTPIVGLGRAGDDTFDLRVFTGCSARRGTVIELDADAPPRPLASFGDALYYRSSLCSTARGRPLCDALERGARLVPITSAEWPARSSSLGHAYDAPTVRVGLHRIRGRAP